MAQAKNGDKVEIAYTGRLGDGTVFDSSEGQEPLAFTLGDGMVIPGFEEAVMGMENGDKKTVTIIEADAYGPHNEDLIIKVERTQLPKDLEVSPGQHLHLQDQEGNPLPVMVKELDDTHITLDANHPLAGKDLIFDLELLSIA